MSCRLPPFSEGRLTPPITTGMLAVINGAVAGTSTGLCQAMKCAPKLSPWAQAQSHLRLATLCLRKATSHVRVKASQRSATCAAWAMRTSGGWLVVGTPVTNPVSLVVCMRSENIKFFSVDVDGFLAQYAVAPANILWQSPKVRACMCLILCVRRCELPLLLTPECCQDMPHEIVAMQESLGNSVYTVSESNVEGKDVVIFGLGPTGEWCLLRLHAEAGRAISPDVPGQNCIPVCKAMGARKVIAVAGSTEHIALAKKVGVCACV